MRICLVLGHNHPVSCKLAWMSGDCPMDVWCNSHVHHSFYLLPDLVFVRFLDTIIPFRNNEKLEAKGFWLLATTACRVYQLDFLQRLMPATAGDRALGCRRCSPIRWGESWGGARASPE